MKPAPDTLILVLLLVGVGLVTGCQSSRNYWASWRTPTNPAASGAISETSPPVPSPEPLTPASNGSGWLDVGAPMGQAGWHNPLAEGELPDVDLPSSTRPDKPTVGGSLSIGWSTGTSL